MIPTLKEIGMTISELRRATLPDDIVGKLLQATEAYTEMSTLLKIYPDLQNISTKILFLLDAYYWAKSKDENIEINSVIQDCFINNQSSYVSRFMQSYQACKAYAEERKSETGVLTAVDIVKINHTIFDLDDSPLFVNNAVFNYMLCIEPFWLILHELYNPKRQYPLLLEAAIALSRFISFAGEEKLGLTTLAILLSSVFENGSTFGGLVMQWSLLTNPRRPFSDTEDEHKLMHILTVFEKIWRFHSMIVYRLVGVKAELLQKLQTNCPALALPRTAQLLADMTCIRINDLKSEMNISSKTAINHLKLLEQSGILYSLKVGRDRFYFNNVHCDIIQNLV